MNRAKFITAILLLTVLSAPNAMAAKPVAKAKGPIFEDYGEIPDGKALVYIYRNAEVAGYKRRYRVQANGDLVTIMMSGGYFPALVDPGHVVISADRYDSVEFDLAPGDVRWVRFDLITHFATMEVQLTDVDPEMAALEIASAKRLEPAEPD